MPWISEKSKHITWPQIEALVDGVIAQARKQIAPRFSRVLLLPPDITRMHSGSGRITEMFYEKLSPEADVHVIPTLGQHVPHTPEQNKAMFGSIPNERIHAHDWINGCVEVGEIPASLVKELSGGLADWPIRIGLNSMLMDGSWDLIVNIGHVVPHEVLGFANHNKNYFIGVASKNLICDSHMMAATCGIENNLGNLLTPLRRCFNWAEEKYLGNLPDCYVQVVLSYDDQGELVHTGFHAGDDLDTYLEAAKQSREENVTMLDEPIQKIVCVMQGDEFFSTWVSNKSIYRTRMALADGGELIVLAPGLERFGEQREVDDIIRKYGYCGTPRVSALQKENADLQDLAHAAAHLMHGSTEGRFKVTYAPGHISKSDIELIGYQYADFKETWNKYKPEGREQGWHTLPDGEKFYFIPTPSAGLWATKERLLGRESGFGK